METSEIFAQARDEDLAAENDKGRKDGQSGEPALGDENQDDGGDQKLIGYGIEEAAQLRDLAASPGEVAIQEIGHAGDREEPAGEPTPEGAVEIEQQDDERNGGDPRHRQQIR